MRFLKSKYSTENMSDGILIRSNEVTLSYENCVVVSGLNFEVRSGDYLCIVGDNGSGKSTLLKALLGLKNISGGSLYISANAHRTGFGYLPQTTVQNGQDFPASVKEIVLSGCIGHIAWHPFYTKKEKELAKVSMERTGILDLASRRFCELSGGQKQRVLLARAYCAAGEVILLDEPVSSLDPLSTAEMYELVYKMNREDGKTVIMISHDIPSAVKYATNILHVGGVGSGSFFGNVSDYLEKYPLQNKCQ